MTQGCGGSSACGSNKSNVRIIITPEFKIFTICDVDLPQHCLIYAGCPSTPCVPPLLRPRKKEQQWLGQIVWRRGARLKTLSHSGIATPGWDVTWYVYSFWKEAGAEAQPRQWRRELSANTSPELCFAPSWAPCPKWAPYELEMVVIPWFNPGENQNHILAIILLLQKWNIDWGCIVVRIVMIWDAFQPLGISAEHTNVKAMVWKVASLLSCHSKNLIPTRCLCCSRAVVAPNLGAA